MKKGGGKWMGNAVAIGTRAKRVVQSKAWPSDGLMVDMFLWSFGKRGDGIAIGMRLRHNSIWMCSMLYVFSLNANRDQGYILLLLQ